MKSTLQRGECSHVMEERSWWDLWNTSYRAEDNRDVISTQLFAHVAAVVRDVTQGQRRRILEVACGTGALSRQIDFSGYHGVDMSSAAIEIARGKVEAVCQARACLPTYEAADLHEWSPPPDSFDLVLCIDAISCFRDQSLVTRKMARMLSRGGLLIMTTVNPVVYNRIRRVGGVRLENGPVSHWLSRRELHDLVGQADLSIERSYTVMPRGDMGWLRIVNSARLNNALGSHCSSMFRRMKEMSGLGQYRVVVARKG
jgi:2-polyprenyl-3-methyl-5-hydroxy-6-metoxy-1,4-benzoquinol methylase